MKISVSLSDQVGERLATLANSFDSSISNVVESALRRFEVLAVPEQAKAVRETHATKRAMTRNGWMSVFWEVMASEFGAPFVPYNVMAARTYEDCYVNFLMSHVAEPDTETDPLIVNMWKRPGEGGVTTTNTVYYKLQDSVFDAARATAVWIRTQKAK